MSTPRDQHALAVRHRRPRPAAERRRGRRGGESGQALVEFVLVLPVVALIMGVAFDGWNAMQLDIRLTSAARAGAIQAASDLAANDAPQTAWDAATAAVNAEEGDTGVYQDTDPSAQNYVHMATSTQSVTAGNGPIAMNVVTITISRTPATLVPLVSTLSVNTTATARYS
jgi:Flp pilus assembly protein TadG